MPAINPETNRLLTVARHLTPDDLKVLEEGKPVYLSGFSPVLPQDLEKIDRACPGWRERLKQPKASAQVVSFPLWDETDRGSPRCVLRSALFAVVGKGRRKALERAEIVSVPGVRILFTGVQLDQFDLDVYLQCLHLAKGDLSKPVYISEKAFLAALGRAGGKKDRMRLEKSLSRLNAGSVAIRVPVGDGVIEYGGPLLFEYLRRETEHSGKSFARINPKLAVLFDSGLWVALNWEARKALKGHPLAAWLYAFYATHDDPIYLYKVAKIKELCGSDVRHLYEFRRQLKKAMEKIVCVTGWRLWIDEHDCLRVDKTVAQTMPNWRVLRPSCLTPRGVSGHGQGG